MKQLRNKFKQLLPLVAALAFFMGTPSKAMADDTAYAIWCDGNKTLYFGFGELPSYGELYNGQEVTSYWSGAEVTASGSHYPSWKNTVCPDLWHSYLKHVVFEPSFINVLPVSTAWWFDGACDLEDITGLEYLNTSCVTEMTGMFHLCQDLTSLDLSTFDTKNVSSMTSMFHGTYDLNKITFGGKFDTSNVTAMNSMFEDSGISSLDLSSFNTKEVREMKAMFKGCNLLSNIKFGDNFNTENVTTMAEMFSGTSGLKNIDLSGLNTSNVTSMYQMFYQSGVRNIKFGGKFNTSKVKSFASMFQGCYMTSLDLSSLTCTEASCNDMFLACGSLVTLKMGDMDVSTTSQMFKDCMSLKTLDLRKMSTKNTTSMYAMFSNCSKLESIYVGNNWSTENVENSENMFNNCTSIVGNDGTTYDSNKITAEFAHTNAGGYMSIYDPNKQHVYAIWCDGNKTLYFITHTGELQAGDAFQPAQGDAQTITSLWSDFEVTATPAPGWSALYQSDIEKVVFESSFAEVKPTSTNAWFSNCTNLTSITGLSNLNTEDVTRTSYMFYACSKLTSLDLSNFKTGNVTSMQYMFYQCSSLKTLDLSSFDTKKVSDMSMMFYECTALETIYVGDSWNTNSVVISGDMFTGCSSLTGGDGTKVGEKVNKKYAYAGEGGYLTKADAQDEGVVGDANGDGVVDAADIVEIVNFLLGNKSEKFNEKNADANNSGGVTKEDIGAVVTIIMSK